MPDQRCPNCQVQHDVSIFVTGQRVRCSKCGIRFEVHREDASSVPGTPGVPDLGEAAGMTAPPRSGAPVPEAVEGSAAIKMAPSAIADDETAISKGVSIPGFEVLHILGRGGMGDVYLARQVSLDRKVAVKVLSDQLAKDTDFIRRFEREATALATLSHPNVVSIIDRGEHGGTFYFVMEYVDGHSLRDVLRGGAMEPGDALKVVTQVCRAIDYAHGRGVIHRDLKPENILIDVHGHVKVADFGLAGIIGGDERLHLTRTDVAMGTFNYMAPEQRKNARDVDGRADLYSLGVVLYELLTGDVPVGRFRLPSEIRAGLDSKVDRIVERALESNPSDRYQRASAIHEDLEGLVGSGGLTVAPAPARQWESGGDTEGDETKKSDSGSRISEFARNAESAVDRAGRGLFKVVRLGAALAALAVITVVIIGSVALIRSIWGEGATDPGTPDPNGEVRPERPLAVDPPESPLIVPLSLREDDVDGGAARRFIDFQDDTAGTIEWFTHRGWWEHKDGTLVDDVFRAGQGVIPFSTIPRAFVGGERYYFDGYRIETRVTLSRTPPGDRETARDLAASLREASSFAPPEAELYLYRNKNHFLVLTIRLGDEGGFFASWNLDDEVHMGGFEGGSGLPEPVENESFELAMWVEGGSLHAQVDGRMIGSAAIGELTEENWGKAGVGCRWAVCTFDFVRITGRTRPPPGQEVAADLAPAPAEP